MLKTVCSVCVGMVVLMVGCALAYEDTSNGEGTGVQCGNIKCAPFASCTSKLTCVCDTAPYDHGNGYLVCHTSDFISTFIENDPHLETFDKDKADLPIPCRYDIVMSDTIFLDDNGDYKGICWFDIKAFNRKDKGKIYLHGFDAAVRTPIMDQTTGSNFRMSVRKTGMASNGNYAYQIQATDGYHNTEGPFHHDEIDFYDPVTGLRMMECNLDKEDNLAMINISHCGTWLYFRAYDHQARRDQKQIPGLAIVIKKAHIWEFYDTMGNVALIPEGYYDQIAMADLEPFNSSNTAKIVYRALASEEEQINPFPNMFCNAAGQSLKDSGSNKAKALDNCLWMLQSPKFIRCYDQTINGEPIMELFESCVRVVSGVHSCDDLKDMIRDKKCHQKDPDNQHLQKFMSSPTCDLEN